MGHLYHGYVSHNQMVCENLGWWKSMKIPSSLTTQLPWTNRALGAPNPAEKSQGFTASYIMLHPQLSELMNPNPHVSSIFLMVKIPICHILFLGKKIPMSHVLLWYCFTASADEKAIYKGSPGCTPSDSKMLPRSSDPKTWICLHGNQTWNQAMIWWLNQHIMEYQSTKGFNNIYIYNLNIIYIILYI